MTEHARKKTKTSHKTKEPVETPVAYNKRLSMNRDEGSMDHLLSSIDDIMNFQVWWSWRALPMVKRRSPWYSCP